MEGVRVTMDDLLRKIGQLCVENEMLRVRNTELERQVKQLAAGLLERGPVNGERVEVEQ